MTPRMPRSLLVIPLALAICTCPSPARSQTEGADGKRCFNGYGYTLKGGEYRYTEHHEQTRHNGRVTTWDVSYVGDNGKIIATKHMDFSDHPTVPTYTLTMRDSGYKEGIIHSDGRWSMFRRESSQADQQTESFSIDGTMAADSGFNQLVQRKFDALMQGETIPFHFAAAGRQSVIDLRARRGDDTTFEGESAVVFVAELDMFLINFFVDSLKLTYNPDSKQLLEYRGIGNLHNARGDVYPVRVTYSSRMPPVAREHGAPKAACGALDHQTNGSQD